MSDNDSKLIWESLNTSPINRVSCHCDDCGFWAEGNKCVAESIKLSFGKDSEDNTICICDTYTK